MPETTNEDLKKAFAEHAVHDEAFQSETRETDKSIQATLALIVNKLDPLHVDYINKGVELRLLAMEHKMELLYEIYEGFVFGRKAIMWTAGIVGGLSLIIGSIFTTIHFVK